MYMYEYVCIHVGDLPRTYKVKLYVCTYMCMDIYTYTYM
jgi:hypothetical protein